MPSGTSCTPQVSISVTLMHQQAAKSHPAGPGRSDPNENPKLPAPERVHFNLLRPDLMMLDLVRIILFRPLSVNASPLGGASFPSIWREPF